jgi:DNA-binding SARP family transcriptional activator
MDFRLLGPLEVLHEGRAVALGGSKQRALLAVFLLHANETLTTDRLIDELWGDRPPATAAKNVQMRVSRLRKALAAQAAGGLVVTRERGYELELDPGRLDSHRFERLLDEGRSELAGGHPERAAAALEAALAMWRGAPLADLTYEPFAQREIARLQDLRAAALEQLVEAKLALGGHAEVISQLEMLIAEHPYRERLRAQLMLALYRCDRQADALQAYQDARRQLVEELGIEPGERLRELERAILVQDPVLAAPLGRDDEEAGLPGPAPAELPTGVVTFLLTDIEDSSGLWEADPEGMAAALELHDGLIARTVDAHAGRLLKTKGEGDATVTAFRRSSDAVAAAVDIQGALAAASWPGGLELRVRIALHTGEAHEREGDYFGPALNRAARLRSLVRGGATVMSQATAEIVHDRLPREVELVELGRQELRGLSRPENVFELRTLAARAAPAPGVMAVEPAAPEAAVEIPRGVFVGRERELAALDAGLDDAFAGHGRLFLLGGEPGIGKSRLAEELLAHAAARRARVLVGRCWEAGGAPAYWPWVQSLRPYLRESDAESLRSQLGEGSADVAQLLPELRDLLADLPPAPSLEFEGARFRLFDSMTAFLKRAAAARPLVLALDDLHAADEPSLLLLRFVARELGESRLLIVGAYRDVDPMLADPLTTTLTELAREPVTRTLRLAGLGEADVARFIEVAAPGAAAADLAAMVHAETEGNPLFVGETVRLLAAEKRLNEPATAPLAIPQSVREVIGRRLHHLSEDCNRLLTLASVLGREFDLDALASVSGLERGAVLELLDEAIEARVISEVPGGIGRIRFAHALIRDAAYHRLTRSRRIQLHREVGEALETLYCSDLDPHLAELARHFFEAAAGGDHDMAITYARRAGEQAERMLAYEESARLYRMALAALDSKQPPDEPTRCELLLSLGEAQARSGEMASAKETFARAADVAKDLSLPDPLARAAIGYGGRFVWVRAGKDRRLVPLLQDALAALPEDDSVLRVKLLARLAGALRDQPSPRTVASITNEAVEMARRMGDPGTLAYALDGLYAGIRYPQQTAEWRAMADELVEVAECAGDKERTWAGHQHRLGPLMLVGDLDGVDAELQAMERLADELRQPAQLWAHSLTQTMRVLFAGCFEEAEASLEWNRELGHRAQTPDITYTGARLQQLFVLRREQGRLYEVEAPLARYIEEYPELVIFRCALATLWCDLGRHAEARDLLEQLASDSFADLPGRQEWFFGAGLLAEVCAQLDDRPHAAPLYELLIPYAGCNLLNWVEVCAGSVSRYLGLLATTMSRWQDAERHFQAAIEMDRRTGGRPWLAHTQADYARMLLARGTPHEREHARELLQNARAIYDQLGMHTHAARASALSERAGRQAAGR